jgi:hypothetical protein
MLFNPYTGRPRDPRDIASDPGGLLIVDPDAPLLAAPRSDRTKPHLLTPRDWQADSLREANELLGTPEGAAKLVEAKRYGALADEIERLRAAQRVVDGLVWAIAMRDVREVAMLFDTDAQANAFVASISADPGRRAAAPAQQAPERG